MTVGALPLSRDRILACAVEVADRDGLDATSLRKVASELAVHVTSLYNHVATKEALLDGIGEELLARADVPVGEVDWEVWVRRFVTAMSALASEHPGAFEVFMRRPVQGARASATFESALEAFHRAGLGVTESYAALKVVTVAVLGCCVEQASASTDSGSMEMTDISRLPATDFPLVHELVADARDVDVVGTLVEVLVAGIAALVGRA